MLRPNIFNTEGLRSAFARLRNRTGPTLTTQPSSPSISTDQTYTIRPQTPLIVDSKTTTNQANGSVDTIEDILLSRTTINKYTPKEECSVAGSSLNHCATACPASSTPVTHREIMPSNRCAAAQLTTSSPNSRCFRSTRSAAMVALALRNPNPTCSGDKSNKSNTTDSAESTFSVANNHPSWTRAQNVRTTLAHQMNGLDVLYMKGSVSSGSDNDTNNSTAASSTSALKRLYFKSGRNSKNILTSKTKLSVTHITRKAVSTATVLYHSSIGGTTPDNASTTSTGVQKVIMRGSSTASMNETYINTSTDSASTMITNVTHTDTSETFDSLDLGDNSGPSDAHFSSIEEPLLTTIAADAEHDATEIELTSCSLTQHEANLHDSTESQESCLSIQMGEPSSTTPLLSSHRKVTVISEVDNDDNAPNTAPVLTSASKHFTFETPKSPKSALCNDKTRTHFTFRNSVNYGSKGTIKTKGSPKSGRRRSQYSCKNNSTSPTVKESQFFENGSSPTKVKSRQISSSTSTTNQRKYSSSSSSGSNDRYRDANGIIYPFEREAIEYGRIQRAISSSSCSTSASDEIEPCSVYERKYATHFVCNNKMDMYQQQYSLLMKNEQKQQQQQHESVNVKNSKRLKSDINISMKYLPASDAFSPQPTTTTVSPPNVHYSSIATATATIPSELSKFNDIAEKFDQMPPRHAANIINPFNNNSKSGTTLKVHNNNCTNPNGLNNINTHNPQIDSGGIAACKKYNKTKNKLADSVTNLNDDDDAGDDDDDDDDVGESSDLIYDLFNSCQFTATACGNSSTNPNNGGPINVTTNPMEAAVCAQPRATIVVQQPSLSLDNAVETLIIRNENEFIGIEQGKENSLAICTHKRNSQYIHQTNAMHQQHQQSQQVIQQKQKRDDNIKQLLDVTNTLTFEELRDFEMRYGSPHHSRSQSVKAVNTRTFGPSNQLCLPQQRSRVASMPNTGVEEEYYRLRHFSITGKGVINRGDSLKSRRSRSNNSVASSNSSNEHLTTATHPPVSCSNRNSTACSLASSRESSTSNPGNGPFNVLMVGAPAVGKSSLVSQFMTSEYLHAYDTSIDDDSGEKSVSVLLNGEESELIFIDHAYTEMTPDDCLNYYDPHGYCIIYSTADRSSFNMAERALQVLWTNQNIAQKAVILVANKADLARSRLITADEGKTMATAYDCKFIETSVGINHNVDELLVGLLSQIRLKLENPEKSRDLFRKRSVRKSKRRPCSPLSGACLAVSTNLNSSNVITDEHTLTGSARSSPRKYRGSRTSTSLKVKGLLGRVWARDSKSKSCENLHVL